MTKAKRASSDDEIPVWFIEIRLGHSWALYHLRLSVEVAKGLKGKLRRLVSRKRIGGFQIQRVDELVVPAFHFYEQFGLDR